MKRLSHASPVLALAPALALLLALAPTPLLAQGQGQAPAARGADDDCAFLERSFQEVYDGLRHQGAAGGQGQGQQGGALERVAQQNPQLATMFVEIQQNIILMHQGRGCDASRLVDLARRETSRYANR
jgi:hypothetical protein